EMGWHILFYNIRRNLVFDGKDIKESLSFYFFIIEIYFIPDKALDSKTLKSVFFYMIYASIAQW
ncbi:MAG: hypothetical protein U9Q06_01405, partial [Nanoarchaeota archaeon]|nr:hypothetical protein [Nanoarchaeota archaeon]